MVTLIDDHTQIVERERALITLCALTILYTVHVGTKVYSVVVVQLVIPLLFTMSTFTPLVKLGGANNSTGVLEDGC